MTAPQTGEITPEEALCRLGDSSSLSDIERNRLETIIRPPSGPSLERLLAEVPGPFMLETDGKIWQAAWWTDESRQGIQADTPTAAVQAALSKLRGEA